MVLVIIKIIRIVIKKKEKRGGEKEVNLGESV